MPDIIRILPDSVANQIAAGEVIQRPSSAVKEMLENAIDAGATEISLIIKDAGKTLIQITDNGSGMSETDARLSFERHATSKIKESNDLFTIRTMGFRGEALASIGAISQVEVKTRREEDALGTAVVIEGSKVKSQETCSCPKGTTFSVKNIFFNVPARRNFLKSDQVETNHIIEEFHRVALAFPEVSFSMFHNNKELFHLHGNTSLKQRITSIFGKSYTEKIIPLEQSSDYVNIYGFIGKPEFAKKNRGEQYFFVNRRFIKHSYLNHAVSSAFIELIPASSFPSYFIYFEINPKSIDVNLHPTKTEIKFVDERIIYAMLLSSVKQSLGKFNVTPTINFEVEKSFDLPHSYRDAPVRQPQIRINPEYNPFEKPKKSSDISIGRNEKFESGLEKTNKENWEMLYNYQPEKTIRQETNVQQIISPEWDETTSLPVNRNIIQITERYIITKIKSGLLIVDQINAGERIYYEHFLNILENNSFDIQQQLFPQQIELSVADAEIMREIKNDLLLLGFEINDFGPTTFVVNGIPANTKIDNIQEVIDGCIESYKSGLEETGMDKKSKLAQAMAKNIVRKSGKYPNEDEMLNIIDRLFACKIPGITPDGKKTHTIIRFDEIENRLK